MQKETQLNPQDAFKRDMSKLVVLFENILPGNNKKQTQENPIEIKNKFNTLKLNLYTYINKYDRKVKELQRENNSINQSLVRLQNENKKINSDRNTEMIKFKEEIGKIEKRLKNCEDRNTGLMQKNKELMIENQKYKEDIEEMNRENNEKSENLKNLIQTLTQQVYKMHNDHVEDIEYYEIALQQNKELRNQREKLKEEFEKYHKIYHDTFEEMYTKALEQYDNKKYQEKEYRNFTTKKNLILKIIVVYSSIKSFVHKLKDVLDQEQVDDKEIVEALKELLKEQYEQLNAI